MRPKTPGRAIEWLFPKVRAEVLARLLLSDKPWYGRELAQMTGMSHSTINTELKGLTAAGILLQERSGNRTYYRANRLSPLFPELRMLLIKTSGIADVLRDALEPLKDKVRVAFIYGSVARGEERADSDVDVMVIGDASFSEVVGCTYKTQEILRREVNPSVFPVAEYKEKLAEGHHFVTEVTEGEKIYLIGDADELKRLV
jgi:predicted nucleotidyltransferase/biotin operon repressor